MEKYTYSLIGINLIYLIVNILTIVPVGAIIMDYELKAIIAETVFSLILVNILMSTLITGMMTISPTVKMGNIILELSRTVTGAMLAILFIGTPYKLLMAFIMGTWVNQASMVTCFSFVVGVTFIFGKTKAKQ